MERTVDLNCDLGEGFENDEELMKVISSANVACGFHAGDTETMKRTVELAAKYSVAVGAHPGYRDRQGFGREAIWMSENEIADLIQQQLNDLNAICREAGLRIHHVKPHGALYNLSARDENVARSIAEAVLSFDPELILFGLSGSVSISQAEAAGLKSACEAFADRTYQANGSLTPRSEPGAMITDTDLALAQAVRMVEEGSLISTDGTEVPLTVDTICIHGDGPNGVAFATAVRRRFTEEGIAIRAPK